MNGNATLRLFLTLTSLALVPSAWADDPNVALEPSTAFVADWDSVTLAVTGYNPIGSPDGNPPVQREAISVEGNVYILDTNDLIAISTTNTAPLWAFDQDGHEVLFDPNAVVVEPARTWELGDQPQVFRVTLPLDPNQPRPTSLSEFDFTVEALYGRPFRTVAIPAEVTDDWIELTPEFRLRITDANVVGDRCTVVIEEEITLDIDGVGSRSFDPNLGPWVEELWPDGRVNKFSDLDLLTDIDLTDVDGNRIGSGGSSSSSHRGMGTGVTTGTRKLTRYNCSSLEGVYVYYTFALDLYEAPIHLRLSDIPVPGR